jgi:hypothetical protein
MRAQAAATALSTLLLGFLMAQGVSSAPWRSRNQAHQDPQDDRHLSMSA